MKVGGRRGAWLIAILMGVIPTLAVASEATDSINQLNATNLKAAETSEHISDVDSQIATVQAQIDDTNAKIGSTNAGIADAKEHMAGDQAKLQELIRTQYQNNQQTKLEQLVGAKNFSDFVDKEQYLQAGQDKISEAVNVVVKTKKELEAKANELGKLQTKLAAAQNGLNFSRAQAQNQLDQVNGAREELKKKVARYRDGRVVNQGDHVNTGDLIGFEGTSGCSTGPHLHFEVRQNGKPVNPRNFTPGQLHWPLDAGFGVSQEFGRPNWAAPYSFHTGIDISQYFGAPIYAAATGTVSYSGYDRSGFGDHVIIDHAGGLQTVYGHMGARGSDYPSC